MVSKRYPSRSYRVMEIEKDISWTQRRRFEFIEWKLYWEGALNRSDLETAFRISTPQASVDLRRYRESAPDNIAYDATERYFRPMRDFEPRYLEPSADRLLLQKRAYLSGAVDRASLRFRDLPAMDMAPDIVRHVQPDCLRSIMAAMREGTCLEIEYQSLTKSSRRLIAPHALAFDGHRWHARAWACDKDDFRDFVLTRMGRVESGPKADFDPDDDLEWTRKINLELRPHPGLTDEQAAAIKCDYAMEGGLRTVEVRLSMAFYFISRMNLDLRDLPPTRAQIELVNLDEVRTAVEEARVESKRRIVARRNSDAEPE